MHFRFLECTMCSIKNRNIPQYPLAFSRVKGYNILKAFEFPMLRHSRACARRVKVGIQIVSDIGGNFKLYLIYFNETQEKHPQISYSANSGNYRHIRRRHWRILSVGIPKCRT